MKKKEEAERLVGLMRERASGWREKQDSYAWVRGWCGSSKSASVPTLRRRETFSPRGLKRHLHARRQSVECCRCCRHAVMGKDDEITTKRDLSAADGRRRFCPLCYFEYTYSYIQCFPIPSCNIIPRLSSHLHDFIQPPNKSTNDQRSER